MALLDVVEAFFGEPLTPSVAELAANMPFEQAEVLAESIETDRVALHRQLLNEGAPRERVLYTTAALLLRGRELGPDTLPAEIKQMAVLHELTAVAHPLYEWANFLLDMRIHDIRGREFHMSRLGNCMRELLVVAPLVRAGALLLIPTPSALQTSPLGPPNPVVLDRVGGLGDEWLMWQDPVVASLLKEAGIVEEWELEAAGLADPEDLLDAAGWIVNQVVPPDKDPAPFLALLRRAVVRAHPGGAQEEGKLIDAVRITEAWRYLNLQPVPTDEFLLTHLRSAGPLLFDEDPGPASAMSDAVRFRVPSLSEIPIKEVAALRRDGEVFAEVRSCICRAAEVASGLHPQSYHDFEHSIREVALDLIRPSLESMQRAALNAGHRKVLGTALAKGAVSLLFTAGAHAFAPIGIGKGATASGVGHLVNRRGRGRREALTVGVRLLDSLVPSSEPWRSPP